MARLVITIDTDNAAFHGTGAGREVARILRDVADAAERKGANDPTGFLRDSNGNTCGVVAIHDPEGEQEARERIRDRGAFTYWDDVSHYDVPEAVCEIRDGAGKPFAYTRTQEDACAVARILTSATYMGGE